MGVVGGEGLKKAGVGEWEHAVGTHIAVVTAPVLLRFFSARNNTALQMQVSNRAFYKLSRLLFSGVQQSVLAVCASKHTPPFSLFNMLALCPMQQGCGCNRAFK